MIEQIKEYILENRNNIIYMEGAYNIIDLFLEDLEEINITDVNISQGIIERPTLGHSMWTHYGTDGTITYHIKIKDKEDVVIEFYYPERDESTKPVKV